MLSFADYPTIKHAIMKRLDKEPGVDVLEIRILKRKDCIAVGVHTWVDKRLDPKSFFDLPPEFDYRLLHDEIDEIAEQIKAARKDYFGKGIVIMPVNTRRQLAGNGLRGNWKKYAV